MKIILCFTCIMIFSCVVFTQENREIRKKIIPLYSTKADVEKVANPVKTSWKNSYETKDELIIVNYSEMRCVQNGWNVGQGTVLDYLIYPKKQIKFNPDNENITQWIKTADDAGYAYYSNVSQGIQYVVNSGMNVKHIKYTPREKDSVLRCSGFPEYNPISATYQIYDDYKVEKISNWDVGRIGSFLLDVKKSNKTKGYIFIYSKKDEIAQINKLKKRVENFTYNIMGLEPHKVKIAFGGLRDETEIETFLLPNEYSPPVASPKYPFK